MRAWRVQANCVQMARANRDSAAGVVGQTLGEKYHLVRVLGQGGMGLVCEARHVTLGKRFAVKIINRAVPRPDVIAARFRREVRAISAIESDNIVQVFDVGVDPKLGLYMVMEFLPGEDLAGRLARVKKLGPAEAIELGYQIARGLAKAHEARIIHRDLKPANVFLIKKDDGKEQVKLLDFGVSKMLDAAVTETWEGNLTTIGMSVGTPQYMSPEQAQGLELDERTDVWSLGVVLYEMLSGRPAYAAQARAHATIVRIVTEKPAPLSEVAPWVPARLASVVHAALQHDKRLRIVSCHRFAELLADTAEGVVEGFEDDCAETIVVKNPLAPASSRASGPTSFAQNVDTSVQIPVVQARPTRVAWWPALLALAAAVIVTGHIGATRGSTPGAAQGMGARTSRVEPVAAAAPAPALRRSDFVPRRAR